jgi:hypothetical protein
VERRVSGGWRTVKVIRTTSSGAYRVPVRRAGIYRVRAGDVAGPAVRAR